MKVCCEFCGKKMAPQGIPRHISSLHRKMVLAKFRHNPDMIFYLFVNEGRFLEDQLMLPAPCPLTVYSRRPLGFMAAPLPWMRRPKGYQLPQNYARPADLLRAQTRYSFPAY